MTIKELINILHQHRPDSRVLVLDSEYGECDIDRIEEGKMEINSDNKVNDVIIIVLE